MFSQRKKKHLFTHTIHWLGQRCRERFHWIICKSDFFSLDQLKPPKAAVAAFSQNHPYEFLLSVLRLSSTRVLAASEKHQETLSAPFPSGDLISERCLCNGVFPGWSCRSQCLEQVERGKKQTEQQLRTRWRERTGVTKETELWIVGYWPYHALHAGFSVQCLSAGLCYWSEDLTEGRKTEKYTGNTVLCHTVVWFLLFCCLVRNCASIQIAAVSIFLFSLTAHPTHIHLHTHTHTHAHIHTRKMHNFSEYFPHLSSHILFHTEIAAHV